jgi:D-alanyl-D-alanine carboxypeptidase
MPRSLLFILSIVAVLSACGKDSRDYPEVKLKEVVDEFVKDQEEILGLMVQIDIEGQGSYRLADGFTDIFKKTAVQPGDRFLIGSITKMFTAALVHQLIEEGTVGIDDPIIGHLSPDWAAALADVEYGNEITVGHALSHRSGIFDAPSSSEFLMQMVANPSQKIEPRYMLELTRDKFDPNFKPGTSFAYASLNYILLGNLIENVSKKPYELVLRERIVDKLGLTHTYFSQGPFGSNQAGITHGYMNISGQAYDGQEFDSGWAWTAGAIISNNDDLIRFIKELAAGRLFNRKETFAKMHTVPAGNNEYGFGLVVIEDPLAGEAYGHIGFFGGTSSIVCYYPERKTAISICINFAGMRSSLKAIDLMDMIIRAFA